MLTLVHRVDGYQPRQPAMGDLLGHQGLRDDADHFAACGQGGIGQRAH